MKKINSILVVLLLTVFIFSCKDDEEMVSPLVGTWTLTTEVYSNCIDSDWNGTDTYNCAADIDQCVKVTFTTDNKFTITFGDGSLTVNGTYSVSGTQLTLTSFGDSDLVTFNINGNTLTLTYNDGDCDVTETYTKS
jgi:hypothetical protein